MDVSLGSIDITQSHLMGNCKNSGSVSGKAVWKWRKRRASWSDLNCSAFQKVIHLLHTVKDGMKFLLQCSTESLCRNVYPCSTSPVLLLFFEHSLCRYSIHAKMIFEFCCVEQYLNLFYQEALMSLTTLSFFTAAIAQKCFILMILFYFQIGIWFLKCARITFAGFSNSSWPWIIISHLFIY